MRQVWFNRPGGFDVIEVREAPDPEPGAGQVLVRVEAAGVNFADVAARMGTYPDAPPFPFVVGYEVSGIIEAVGEGVDEGRIGEGVVALTRFGGYSSKVVLDEIQVARRPDNVSAVMGAAIPVQGLTAWMMLEEMGRVREGDRVLVHSAGGGVGLMCLDLIKWRKAIAVGTASAGKHAFLEDRGYDQLVDYRSEDFEAALSHGPGFDLIVDPIGGDYWAKDLRLLRPCGRLICFGMSSAMAGGGTTRSPIAAAKSFFSVPWFKVNPISLMNDNIGVMGVNMGHLWDHAERVTGWLEQLLALAEQGVVRPHVHAEVSLDDVAEAHRILHDRENRGKVVLIP